MANIVLVEDGVKSDFTASQLSKKKDLMNKIVDQLYISATHHGKKFSYSDVFFSLAFKSLNELEHIAKQAKAI